VGVVLTVIL